MRCRIDGWVNGDAIGHNYPAKHFNFFFTLRARLPATMTINHLLYLHGFRSSPQSTKARLMAQHVQAQHPEVIWLCPHLPPCPRAAMDMVADATRDWPTDSMAVVGSSLGGFYATWVAEQRACRAVLLNPAVNPARDLEKYIGEQTQFHAPEERLYFKAEYVQELRDLRCGELHEPQNYLAVIAKGDEVLDWREMHTRYQHSKVLMLEGGDHAISNFEEHLPAVMAHLGC
jgi:predicted esterase YcpF (UPF0227 family)